MSNKTRITLKRTCDGCRALDYSFNNYDCSLGYNNKGGYDRLLGLRIIKPQEPCPKPKTYLDYFAQDKIRRGKIN